MNGADPGKADAAGAPDTESILEAQFIDTLEAVEQYIALQGSIASHLKSGFFNIARARYQMGSSKVRTVTKQRKQLSALLPPFRPRHPGELHLPPPPASMTTSIMANGDVDWACLQVGPAQYPAVMYATARVDALPRAGQGSHSATAQVLCFFYHSLRSTSLPQR